MRARIWGCRGSIATPGPETARYGGNTSCVELVLPGGPCVVLDAGTGIRELGVRLSRELPPRIDVLLTHLHLDHLEGLGHFEPIWRADTEIHVWGPPSSVRTLRRRIARYFSPPLFPMRLADAPARIVFHDVTGGEWEIDGLRVRAALVAHPGPTLGYRLDWEGRSLAYLPDHEPALGAGCGALTPDWVSGHVLAAGAHVLLHDSQYSESEYVDKVGWGHSSVVQAVAYAQLAGVARLVLFHHDPVHSDADLEVLLGRARELLAGGACEVELARDGMEVDLDASAPRV